jgi:hypothetical protein
LCHFGTGNLPLLGRNTTTAPGMRALLERLTEALVLKLSR